LQGQTASFRLYAAVSGTASTPNWRVDDLILTYTATAVPEPAGLTLIGIGVVGMAAGAICARRRRLV
jgi:hypothetical protein